MKQLNNEAVSDRTYVTGIKPTGDGRLHLGSYLGVVDPFLKVQPEEDALHFFFLADLHSLTQPVSPKQKQEQLVNLATDLLAVGINPEKTVLFQQSDVLEHAELSWVFETLTTVAKLSGMIEFKEAKKKQKKNINTGLLTYPALQAADILIYKATHVPIGEDQRQHLELTREIARKFNNAFGEIFPEPEATFSETPRIMSLSDPESKMSKSSPSGCLFLDDSPEDIQKKVGSAVTDSENEVRYDPENKAGVSSLLAIYGALTGMDPEDAAAKLGGGGYAKLKSTVAETVIEHFAEFREKKAKLEGKTEMLKSVLAEGSRKAQPVAAQTLEEVKEKMGLSLPSTN